MKRLILLAIVLAAAVCLAPSAPARALGLSPDPVVWSFTYGSSSITLSHDLVAVDVGLPLGGVVLTGSVSPTDVTLVFQAEVSITGSASVTVIGLHPVGPVITAAGWIPGPEPDALTDFDFAAFLGPDMAIGFAGFDFPDGATSDLFFVSFTSLAVGDVLQFMPLPGLGPPPGVPASATVVPEPASGTLVLSGLLVVAARRRRGRASA